MKRSLRIATAVFALGLTGAATVGPLYARGKPATKPSAAMLMHQDMHMR